MILAASGILLKDKKILLLQRSNYTQNFPDHWGCPGGRAEPNETAEENVIREVKEECNLVGNLLIVIVTTFDAYA